MGSIPVSGRSPAVYSGHFWEWGEVGKEPGGESLLREDNVMVTGPWVLGGAVASTVCPSSAVVTMHRRENCSSVPG